MEKRRVAILGATSHIAKGLIFHFLSDDRFSIALFARNVEGIRSFLASIGKTVFVDVYHIDNFGKDRFDVVINCVGVGTPKGAMTLGGNILFTTEQFDNIIIDYLSRNAGCRYVNFSSGAVYGKSFSTPVNVGYRNCIDVNAISGEDFYSIAKLNSEAKHRMFSKLPIIDIRVFSYFSRFIDIDAGYLITSMMKCVRDKTEFVTNGEDIVRDFTVPSELYSLVTCCILSAELNVAIDVRSLKPLTKFELIDFFRVKFGLKVIFNSEFIIINTSGNKSNYYSVSDNAKCVGFIPTLTSIDAIDREIRLFR